MSRAFAPFGHEQPAWRATPPPTGREDADLLERYVRDGSDAAFTEFVRRHIDLVYSAALRRCGGNAHRAEEITQHVFTAAARHADRLSRHTAVCAWLHLATRNAAVNLAVTEQRRMAREQEATMTLQLASSEMDWTRLRRVLDPAIDELGETDRTAIILRYFDKRSFAEIGAALNLSENTARMRTERALDKLKASLARRGITSTAAALGTVLVEHAVASAPRHLAVTVAHVATNGSIDPALLAASHHPIPAFVLKHWIWVTSLFVVGAAIVVALLASRPEPPPTIVVITPEPSGSTVIDLRADGPATGSRTSPAATALNAPVRGDRRAMGRLAARPAAEAPASPEDLLKRVGDTYRALRSYEDTGEIVRDDGAVIRSMRTTFRTRYAQPARFNVEWHATWVGATRKTTFTRSTSVVSDGENSVCTMGNAQVWTARGNPITWLVSSAGSSKGITFHIPRLLAAARFDANVFSPVDLQNPQLLSEETVDGVPCHVVTGQHPSGHAYALWIGKSDFLIRKISTNTPLEAVFHARAQTRAQPKAESKLVEIVYRDIRANEEIPDDAFELPIAR